MLLYRGVPQKSPAYEEAINGVAKPRGCIPSPHLHVMNGSGWTPYTSWTDNPDLAWGFATGAAGDAQVDPGVVLKAAIPVSQLTPAPMGYAEGAGEYLVKGEVVGASAIPVSTDFQDPYAYFFCD